MMLIQGILLLREGTFFFLRRPAVWADISLGAGSNCGSTLV
jgi:hypothetical protein